jgi:hypothetical protein
VAEEIRWNTDELKAFARSLNHDKDGRALKKQLQSQLDSVSEDIRDRLRENVRTLPHLGDYPQELAESLQFSTKLIGGKNARVSVVGEGKTSRGKWREVGKLLDNGVLFHPAWGHWRGNPPPQYLREDVPEGPPLVDRLLSEATPRMQDEIRSVLNDYLDKLTDIRKALA